MFDLGSQWVGADSGAVAFEAFTGCARDGDDGGHNVWGECGGEVGGGEFCFFEDVVEPCDDECPGVVWDAGGYAGWVPDVGLTLPVELVCVGGGGDVDCLQHKV